MTDTDDAIALLSPLVGEWQVSASFSDELTGTTIFEWMVGSQFLLQRFEVPHPAAPDGLAVIGYDPSKGHYVQHYFDSRGVARVYEMTFSTTEWRLWRTSADFTPLDFCQRYIGTLNPAAGEIRGVWQSSPDGEEWSEDFELTYTRVGDGGV